MSDDERLARVTLSVVGEPGQARMLDLAGQLGPRGLLQRLREQSDLSDVSAAVTGRLAEVDPERELAQAERQGIRFVIPGDPEWPAQLDDLATAGTLQERGGVPVGLWVKGPLRLTDLAGSVAVVGSRSSTSYGERVAGDIAAAVGLGGRVTVSGGAFGIDYASHRGAVSTGSPTVAVLACGADRVYPAAHREMLTYLGREHAVVSEAPLGAAPHRIRFLARNRLIAALTRGTVVVEAAARSGALNTVNWAQRLNRPVMGVPGPVTSACSVGIHHLIRSGVAMLVTGGDDVLELVGEAGEHLVADPRGPEEPRDALPVRERQVLDAVPVAAGAPLSSIARVAGLGAEEVRGILGRLDERGFVEADGVGWRLGAAAR
ncbi:DNA-processing protein DprA [Nocardioides pelophilus]|uniref:DNA-processing protein DprA n=1 Tax=Nocardioides pelophilus TaxID=2172019 RepID=UPI0015FF9E04|nr:DNA-processing protein DprA [Nocardioides pelophilus]